MNFTCKSTSVSLSIDFVSANATYYLIKVIVQAVHSVRMHH